MKFIPSNLSLKYDVHDFGIPFIVYPCYEGIETDGLDYLDGFDILHISYGYELELEFTFLNSISSDVDKDLLISNRSTIGVDIDFLISNKLFLYNEVEKNFISKNKLLSFLSDEYTGFYFSKIHGV